MEEEKQKKEPKDTGPDAVEEGFELLDKAGKAQDITVRDDQYDYHWIKDAAERCRKSGFRFRLMDTGRFEKIDLMWLIDSGLDLYTDDQTRKDFKELEELVIECQKKDSLLAYLQTGAFGKEEESESSVFSGLVTMARTGAHIYVTNREDKTELAALKDLAGCCREGNTRLVYYHHGSLDPILEDIGSHGAWIHITDKSIDRENLLLLLETCQKANLNGGGLIVHLEDEVEYDLAEELIEAGASVLFLYAPFDYKSPFKELEKRVGKKKYDFRAYYLQHDFFL
ncbi:MAG: hypothetical protein R6V00_11195 [Candidatus Aminicenantes bacterium]